MKGRVVVEPPPRRLDALQRREQQRPDLGVSGPAGLVGVAVTARASRHASARQAAEQKRPLGARDELPAA
jgi:hypothetical protein